MTTAATDISASLANKVALVTGGSRGLGRGIVAALAARGARVVVLARDAERLSALAQQVPGIVPVAGDAADAETAERLFTEHDPDLIVLCAGASPPLGPFFEQTWEQFSENWQVDTKSAFLWLRLALRAPAKPGRHVIVVSSGAAIAGSPVSGGYAGAKRAQWFLAEYAAGESARQQRGLRVHCLLPSLTPHTELGRAGVVAYAARLGVTPEEFAQRFSPPLTPEIAGAGVAELSAAPAQWGELVYRLSGTGLAPLNPPK